MVSPKSPTECYPPDIDMDMDVDMSGNYFTYDSQNGGFVRPPDGPMVRGPDGQFVPEPKPPPKPARVSEQYEFQVR